MGEWVARDKGRLIAHAPDGVKVYNAAIASGVNPTLMHRVTEDEDLPWWGGW
jgi:hypothetical protein